MFRARINNKGFTLMEVMVAIAIVAIVSGPLLQTFVTSSRVGRHSYDTDKANAVSVKTVEEVKGNPGDVKEPNYHHDRTYDSDLVKWIHTFTKTYYYDVNWGGPHSSSVAPDGTAYPFRALTTVTAEEDTAAGVDSLSYLPELVDKDSGQEYRLGADFINMSTGTYSVTVTSDHPVTTYTVATSQSILTNTLTGIKNLSHRISRDDCVSGIIPVVIDIGNNATKYINFTVDNQTGAELGLYIYSDYQHDPPEPEHYVTADLTSGSMSVNYMKTNSASLLYDRLNVNVQVFREADGSEMTDYTTMIYLGG